MQTTLPVAVPSSPDTYRARLLSGQSMPRLSPHPTSPLTPPVQTGGIQDLNLRRWVPPAGMASVLLWAASNVAEQRLHSGAMLPLNTPAGRAMVLLAGASPLMNGVYGGLSALAAGVNGYAFRTAAFGLYGALSLLTAPIPMALSWLRLRQAQLGGHLAPKALKRLQQLSRQNHLINEIVPTGILMGLFTLTNVAQSHPQGGLRIPKGNTWAELTDPKRPADERLGSILLDNLRTEWGQTVDSLSHPAGWVPSLFAWTGLGRVVGAASAAGGAVAERLSLNALQEGLRHLQTGGLFIGQWAGAGSALMSQFSDWPAILNRLYQTSAVAFGASAVAAASRRKLIGLDAVTLAKLGAFLQGSAYFLNLTQAGQGPAPDPQKPAEPATPMVTSAAPAPPMHPSAGAPWSVTAS